MTTPDYWPRPHPQRIDLLRGVNKGGPWELTLEDLPLAHAVMGQNQSLQFVWGFGEQTPDSKLIHFVAERHQRLIHSQNREVIDKGG